MSVDEVCAGLVRYHKTKLIHVLYHSMAFLLCIGIDCDQCVINLSGLVYGRWRIRGFALLTAACKRWAGCPIVRTNRLTPCDQLGRGLHPLQRVGQGSTGADKLGGCSHLYLWPSATRLHDAAVLSNERGHISWSGTLCVAAAIVQHARC